MESIRTWHSGTSAVGHALGRNPLTLQPQRRRLLHPLQPASKGLQSTFLFSFCIFVLFRTPSVSSLHPSAQAILESSGLESSQVWLILGFGYSMFLDTHLRAIINAPECWQNIQICRQLMMSSVRGKSWRVARLRAQGFSQTERERETLRENILTGPFSPNAAHDEDSLSFLPRVVREQVRWRITSRLNVGVTEYCCQCLWYWFITD